MRKVCCFNLREGKDIQGESEKSYADFNCNIGCSGLDSKLLLSVKIKAG
jgi:hypothetical protein